MKNPNLKLKLSALLARAQGLKKYSLVAFVVFLGAVYGFVLYRVQAVSNEQPADTAISTQVPGTHSLHIDQTTVRQLQSLRDNSVSVQGLFDQARNNPFQQ